MTKNDDRDHDLLIEINTKMAYVKERFENGSKKMDALTEKCEAMEERVRKLENWKSKIAGIALAVSVIITIIINLMFIYTRGG